MITITHEPTGVARQYPDHKLEMLCLTLQGGGETEQQTANAMACGALVKEGLPVTVGHFKIEMDVEEDDYVRED